MNKRKGWSKRPKKDIAPSCAGACTRYYVVGEQAFNALFEDMSIVVGYEKINPLVFMIIVESNPL